MAKDSTSENQKRRQYGTGNITQRSDGRWMARVELGHDENGVRKRKTLYGKTQVEVKRKLKEFQQDAINQHPQNNQTTRFKDYIEHWLVNYKKSNLKRSSYDRLENTINTYINPTIGNITLKNLSPNDIQKLINKLFERGLSYSSIKKVYDACNACLKHAVISRDLQFSPCNVVQLPSKTKFKTNNSFAFTEEDVEKILEESEKINESSKQPKYKYRAVYKLILNTGLRIGEVVALDWSDIDSDNKTLTVSKNALYVKDRDEAGNYLNTYSQVIQSSPKSDAGRRVVPLNTHALDALKRLRALDPVSDFLLTTAKGTRTKYHTISRQFNKILEECGIRKGSIHTLRHTFATRLFEKGADVKTVSVILGHSTIAITYDTYIHVIQSKIEDVVSLLDL